MKIWATCPECGNSNWLRNDDAEFECTGCGEIVDTEDMSLVADDD